SGEVQKGAFVFSRDPNEGELIVRVASYKLP
ncbi:TIGR02588 family protein, partial [Oscillatoria salina IIICB1]|nr:TIGR02588 family protein [Oscillatoria salina IIICB1]